MHDVARRPLLAGAVFAVLAPGRAVRAQGGIPSQGGGSHGAGAPGGGELRLGALFPFSGPLALLGDESFRGLEVAVDERGAAGGLGGRPLRLLKGDATDPAQAVAEVRRLIGAERATAVFGTLSSALGLAASQVAEEQSVPYLELGAIADALTERGFRGLFRTCPRAAEFGRLAADAVVDTLAPALGAAPDALRVAILYEDGPYGRSVAAAEEAQSRARGLQLVEKLAYAARATELAPAVQRLRGVGAEVVLHTGYNADVLQFFRAMREMAWRPRMVIGAGGGYGLADTARSLGPEIEGTMSVDFTPFAVSEAAAPGARPFGEAYKRRYGAEPRSGHSLASYFGAQVCLDAMTQAGGADGERLRAAMLATDVAENTTATGWGARFDERGQNTRARPVLTQWQDGRQVTVAPPRFAVAAARGRFGLP